MLGRPEIRRLTYTLLAGLRSAGPGKPPQAAGQDGRVTLSSWLCYYLGK